MLAYKIGNVPPNKGVFMKKIIVLLFLSLFLLSCQTDKCKEVSLSLTNKIADTFDCHNKSYLYDKISYFCSKEETNVSDYPESFVGGLACKLCIGYISNYINEFSSNAKCEKPFVSEEFKKITTDVCSVIIP